jgi:hypothetical protein
MARLEELKKAAAERRAKKADIDKEEARRNEVSTESHWQTGP